MRGQVGESDRHLVQYSRDEEAYDITTETDSSKEEGGMTFISNLIGHREGGAGHGGDRGEAVGLVQQTWCHQER